MRIFYKTPEKWIAGLTKKSYEEIVVQTKSGKRIEISELPDGSIVIIKKNFSVSGKDTVLYKEFL